MMPDVDDLVRQFKAIVGPNVADVDARRVLNLASYDLHRAINRYLLHPRMNYMYSVLEEIATQIF